ncbi:YcxB family protein [Streptomyces sp. NPDC006332]|uniref:YcxB family protein n=1 Tax=Streptomyces sp. NPDC006332 TaxID=3155456 RepID=UPI0033A71E4D
MVMDMGRDAAQEVVELEYRPTTEDYAAALWERRRFSRAGRRIWWLIGLLVVLAGLNAALGLADGDVDLFLLIWPLLSALLLLLAPRLQARQVMRVAARNGLYRAAVSDAGVTVTTDNASSTINWAAQPRYREIRDAFVVFSADKNATCFTVLPKRGLRESADVDRLRTLLDRNLTRA